MGGGMGGGWGSGRSFTINGKSFDPARTNITTSSARVEDWAIRNTSPMDHPFHLHVWPFQSSIAATARRSSRLEGHRERSRRRVRDGSGSPRDIAGATVYHCHILDHEDLGMMGVIKVT